MNIKLSDWKRYLRRWGHSGGDWVGVWRGTPHQLCVFHLLREYRRNIGTAGFAAARRLLDAGSSAEGREWARRIMRATAGVGRY